jgi:hypothetical protein
MNVDAVEIVRETGPVFGALLIGFAFGLTAIGLQLNAECIRFAGETVAPVCQTLAWGDRWALRSVLAGFGLISAAMIADAALDRE